MNTEIQALYTALMQGPRFEVVTDSSKPNQLRIAGRIHPEGLRLWLDDEHGVIAMLYDAAEHAPWTIDISKQYFRDAPRGKRRNFYTWRVLIQAPDVLKYIPDITELVKSASMGPWAMELEEIPLHASPHRHSGPNRKGAMPIKGP